ncbi:hypothetical protein BG004_006331 [Podila humilis]|nr:hypothetical protein BG004_006331 [Podila humilis]
MSPEIDVPAAEFSVDGEETPSSSTVPELKKPVVLIIGAGLGGLTLGLLLQRAGIEFFILERAPKVRPLGASLSLSPNIIPVIEQLGLEEEVKKFSLHMANLDMYEENMQFIGAIDAKSFHKITGYPTYIFAREELYNLLVSKIDPARLLFNKKILSMQQNADGVMVRTSDNMVFHSDILIGADGAYSAVRQSLYKEMDKKGMLPTEDKEDLSMAYLAILGTTKPLDPEKYPDLKDDFSHMPTVLAKGEPISWTTVTLPNNKISWVVWFQISKEEAKDMMFRNSDWGTSAHKPLIEQVRDYPVKHGGTLGDLIEATDLESVSRVYIEEKLFKTWNHGRTALLGDAVHKTNPSGGQGAVSAMQDATILANCIYDIEDPSFKNIQLALADYRSQRFEQAEFQVNLGKTLGKILFGQKWHERLMRKIVYNMPKWAQNQSHMKMASYRPIVTFLPPPSVRTTVKLLPQKPSKRYAKEQAARANGGTDSSAKNSTEAKAV